MIARPTDTSIVFSREVSLACAERPTEQEGAIGRFRIVIGDDDDDAFALWNF